MRWLSWFGCVLLGFLGFAPAAPTPGAVAILYNDGVAESKRLAEFYRDARGIPAANLIGLKMPEGETISREQYEASIAEPLRHEFDKRGWWRRQRNQEGITLPVRNKIQVLVTVRGVPLKIKGSGKASPDRNKAPIAGHDEASVDSELAVLGIAPLALEGPAKNLYFRSDKPFGQARMPFQLLTCRIDAATYATCERMIKDALEVEKTGLWGMAYVDIANKFPQGDQWLESVVKQNHEVGIPTVVDRFNPTLPANYPMTDAAMYFGWYDRNLSGPFLHQEFRFRKGAVAMHLHSFSAEQLHNPNKNWSAGLLEAGAAATLGNVYEPYLHLTHHFGLLHQRLLEGSTWVEACWAAMPATSWQGVIFGDPLYRPFKHLSGTGAVSAGDRPYRALVAAMKQWKDDPAERIGQIKEAAVRMKSGVLLEAVALESMEQGKHDKARTCFVQARELHQNPAAKLRQDLQMVAIYRVEKLNHLAVAGLRKLAEDYAQIPQVAAVKGWLDILDPPPPIPVSPRSGIAN